MTTEDRGSRSKGSSRGRPGAGHVGHGTGEDRAPSSDARAPPGWDANPSSWRQRLPIVGIALVGVVVSGYLALYQLGYLQTVWEPFFGDGSRTILESQFSKLISPGPVPDAALGTFGYLVDAVTGVIGGRERWRTRPWIVVVFGLAVGPLGAVSIALVVIQPVVVGAWCTLCLVSAVISLAMIGPAMDELLASLQYLRRVSDRGGSVWRAFLRGPDSPAVGGGN